MAKQSLNVALIRCAAIRKGELVFSMPKPARHHDIIKVMVDAGVPAPIGLTQGFEQGFLTATAGFNDRQRAAVLVGKTEGPLYSEDLW